MRSRTNKTADQRSERVDCPPAVFHLPRPSKTLAALTTSALALPGIAGTARADAPIERASASSSFSYYKEDNLSPSRFSGTGSRERYEVFTTQLRFDLPVSDRIDLGVNILYEEMSGASPWFVQADANGTPLQVMSGATIEDERFDISADVDFYMDNGKDTISAGISTERDYFSMNFGIAAERNLNEKNTTVSAAGAFSYDWIKPTDADTFLLRRNSATKWSVDLFAGISQLLSRSSTVQATINYKHASGFLSDPYKQVAGLSNTDPFFTDRRPGKKDQVSILLRYRHHFEAVTGSLHLDGRFYNDNYGINSYTTELAWYQNFLDWITITPSVRWYSQGKADFYDLVFDVSNGVPEFRSSDYRLSAYGAVSLKLKAEFEFLDVARYSTAPWLQEIGISEGLDLILALSYERYHSDGDLGIVDVKESDEAPGLVRFHVFAVSLNGRF